MTASARTGHPTARATRRRAVVTPAVVGLLVSAWVHADLGGPPWFDAGQVTVAGLFVAHAVVTALVAVWLLVQPGRSALVAAAVVGLASLGAIVVAAYVRIPSIGPLPVLYEPLWYREKVVAAVAAAVAAAGAAVALFVLRAGRSGGPAG